MVSLTIAVRPRYKMKYAITRMLCDLIAKCLHLVGVSNTFAAFIPSLSSPPEHSGAALSSTRIKRLHDLNIEPTQVCK